MAGIALALGGWCWWAYINSGNPINWLLLRIESTTRSSSFYAEQAHFLIRFLLTPLGTAIQAFPLVIFFIGYKRKKISFIHKELDFIRLLGSITILHWIFFFLAQLKIMAYPDPRFFCDHFAHYHRLVFLFTWERVLQDVCKTNDHFFIIRTKPLATYNSLLSPIFTPTKKRNGVLDV